MTQVTTQEVWQRQAATWATRGRQQLARLGLAVALVASGGLNASCSESSDDAATQRDVEPSSTESPDVGLSDPEDTAVATPSGNTASNPTGGTATGETITTSSLTTLDCGDKRVAAAMSAVTAGLTYRPQLSRSGADGALYCQWGEEDNQVSVSVTVAEKGFDVSARLTEAKSAKHKYVIAADPRLSQAGATTILTRSDETPDRATTLEAHVPAGNQTHTLKIEASGTAALSGLSQLGLVDAAAILLESVNTNSS